MMILCIVNVLDIISSLLKREYTKYIKLRVFTKTHQSVLGSIGENMSLFLNGLKPDKELIGRESAS